MQLALAISESLKDLNQPQEPEASTSSKFENPFTSMGKVQPISAMLERFGFKTKKTYTEYELDLITSSKIAKRSKFQKFPTALTRTSNDKRNKVIRLKIDRVLELSKLETPTDDEPSRYNYEAFSFFLRELQEKLVTTFDVNKEGRSTDEILLAYYVNDLFEPSFVKAGHLLKDWSKIPGRDPSPERFGKACEEIVDKKSSENSQEKASAVQDLVEDCTKYDNAEEKIETLQSYIDVSTTSSCKDIFADIDDFDMDESLSETTQNSAKETSGELADNLSMLHDKLSQVVMEIDDDVVEEETHDESDATIENVSHSSPILIESDEVATNENELNDYIEKLEQSILKKAEESERENSEQIDLTQLESSAESGATIPYDDSHYSLRNHMKIIGHDINFKSPPVPQTTLVKADSPVDINLLSSDDESEDGESDTSKCLSESTDNLFPGDVDDAIDPMMLQNSLTDEDIIAISDEEINYSVRKYRNNNEDPSDESPASHENSKEEAIDLTQEIDTEPEVVATQIEIINRVDQSLIDILQQEDTFNININDTILNLLDTSSGNLNNTKKDRSMKVMQADCFSDSLMEIMRKYGGAADNNEHSRTFRKMRSESVLGNESKRHQSIQANFDNDVVDLTQPMEINDSVANLNNSIHQSLENVLDFSPIAPRKQVKRRSKAKKSLGVQLDDDYFVDMETVVLEPDFKNMTPVELKQQLFKYGIRPLPVKKAVELLEFIYDQIHPKIRIAADEEIDVNNSRREMNITDIVTNIGVQDADDFVFQPGLVEDEDFVLPKMRKSKVNLNLFYAVKLILFYL